MLYLAAHGIPCRVRYGSVYGQVTWHIDADIPPEIKIPALMSGGLFAGGLFLLLGAFYRPLLWVAIHQFHVGIWEPVAVYSGLVGYASSVLVLTEVFLLVSTIMYYAAKEFEILKIETKVVWLFE